MLKTAVNLFCRGKAEVEGEAEDIQKAFRLLTSLICT
jgi:hypothetical protein